MIATAMGFFIVIGRKDRSFEEVLALLVLIMVMAVALGAWLATR